MRRYRLKQHRHFLQPSWTASTYRDRYESMKPHVEHRTVLDLGAGSGFHREDWLHALIRADAAEAVGVELSTESVAGARELGVDLVLGDAESIRLHREFDVVVAGELIEHLSCFRGLLETARAHLGVGGLLVLTTPNAFAVTNFVYRLGGRPQVHHEHTCWFCEDTIRQLLVRHGFDPIEVKYLKHRTPGKVRRVFATILRDTS